MTFAQELLTLPTQPAAAEQALRLVSDGRTSAGLLALVIESDPALAARVMRLANSPYYGVPRRVSNAAHAITLLGRDTVRGIAASAACSLLAEPADRQESGASTHDAGPDGFWRHSVSTAAACSVVAARIGYSTADAFSVGLLHDLGAMLLHRRDPDAFAATQAHDSASAIVAAEIAAFGTTHARVGAAALDAWSFPPAFVEAVALHQAGVEPPLYALGRILPIGEVLALDHHHVPGYPGDLEVERLLHTVRLTPHDLPALHDEIERHLERLVDALGEPAATR